MKRHRTRPAKRASTQRDARPGAVLTQPPAGHATVSVRDGGFHWADAGCADGLAPAGQSQDVLTFPRRGPGRSVEGMPSYLVETFLPRGAAGERTARERRARSAAEELTRQGTRVRFDRTIHVPEDEICFFVFGAPSSREATLVAQQAGLDPCRVVEAVTSPRQ